MTRYHTIAVFIIASFIGAARAESAPPSSNIPEFRPADPISGLPYPMPDEPQVGLLDINRDGRLDVLIEGDYFRNTGRRLMLFVGIPGDYHSFGDFDNDGDLDIFATAYRTRDKRVQAEAWLLRCDKDGDYANLLPDPRLAHRRDEDEDPGLAFDDSSRAHGFLDYNNDGHLDLFVAGNHQILSQRKRVGRADRLLQGDGQGNFVDVTEAAGMKTKAARSVSLAIVDFDLDGNLDLYVCRNDDHPNVLWHNQGDGTFQDLAEEAGVAMEQAASTDVAFADVDHDGDFDLYVSTIVSVRGDEPTPRPRLFLNQHRPSGELKFEDVTETWGLLWQPREGLSYRSAWRAPVFVDVNNDGWHDLLVAGATEGGTIHPMAPYRFGRVEAGFSVLYARSAPEKFVRADTDRNGLQVEDTWGAATGDVDLNGWADLLLGSSQFQQSKEYEWFDAGDQRSTLLFNEGLGTDRYGYLTLTPVAQDRYVTGARFELVLDDGQRRVAQVDTSFGAYSAGTNQLHFGLGPASVKEITVTFPGGATCTLTPDAPLRNAAYLIDLSASAAPTLNKVEGWK